MTRRSLLALGAAVALPVRPATTGRVAPKRGMIVRSVRPEDLEMPLEGFRDFITPVDRFFVRATTTYPLWIPLRLVVPAWAGDSWVKWVSQIRVLDREWDGFYMKTAYRYPGKSVPPGTVVPPEQMVPVTNLSAKSIIHSPSHDGFVVAGKPVTFAGVAWASRPVVAVDISADAGKTWAPAKLGRSEGDFSWREWSYTATLPSDHHDLMVCARTASGEAQPLDSPWNPSGYLWNKVERIGVIEQPPGYREACHACHGEDIVGQQGLTRAQWEREVDKMIRWGAQVKPENKQNILDYLSVHYRGRPMD